MNDWVLVLVATIAMLAVIALSVVLAQRVSRLFSGLPIAGAIAIRQGVKALSAAHGLLGGEASLTASLICVGMLFLGGVLGSIVAADRSRPTAA